MNAQIERGSVFDPGREPFYGQLLKEPTLSPEQAAFVRKTIIATYLQAPDPRPDLTLRRLIPLLKSTSLSPAEKINLLAQVEKTITELERTLRPSAAASQVVRLLGDDSRLQARLSYLTYRRGLIDQAIVEPTATRTIAALRNTGSVEILNAVHEALNAQIPTPVVREAMDKYVGQYEDELKRMITDSLDRSMDVAKQIQNDRLYDLLYRININRSLSRREGYLGSCIGDRNCRKNLIRQISTDGRIFDDFEDYSYIQTSLDKVKGEAEFKVQLFEQMTKTARGPEQLEDIIRTFETEARSPGMAELVRTKSQSFGTIDDASELLRLCH